MIKVRVLYTLLGCRYCNLTESAIIHVNNFLEIGQKIEVIDIMSGDPRCSFLAKLFKSPSLYDWQVPILVVDNPVIRNLFNYYIKSNGKRVLISSIFDFNHYVTMVKGITY